MAGTPRRSGIKTRAARWLLPLTVVLLAIGCARSVAAADSDWAAIEAEARKIGKLTLYHNLPPPGDEGMLAAFAEDYPGIKVETVRLGSGAMMQRFEAETAAGKCPADALMTNYDNNEDGWIDKGWVMAWAPPEAAAYPPEYVHRGHLFTTQLYREAIIYNTAKVKAADAPKAYADLLDPTWKGKVGLNPPWRSV